MKLLVLSENSNGAWPYLYVRSMGPYELRRRAKAKGFEAEIIEWFTYWSKDQLKAAIKSYFSDTDYPVLALSTPFYLQDIYQIKDILVWAKELFPNIKIIHGGARTYDDNFDGIIDVFFLGRSMKMFDDWLDKKDLSLYTVNKDPLVLTNNYFDQVIDNPVMPDFYDYDFLHPKDMVGFEIGVGCKFNCTFCNYELRNSKITNLVDTKQLHEYFDMLYKKYKVQHYFAADDTLNETDEKLEIVAEAVSNLTYSPRITAFARVDIINGRKQQLKLLEKINFQSLFFGIETFNPEVSKKLRKKSGIGNLYETLKQIREVCPNTFTVAGLIIGLHGDSKQHIFESVDKVISDKLIHSLEFYPLHIAKENGITKYDYLSEIDRDPEKHGYKINDVISFHHHNKKIAVTEWESDWTTYKDANTIVNELETHCGNKIARIGHLTYAGLSSMGILKSTKDAYLQEKVIYSKAHALSKQLKELYIGKKLKYLETK